MVAYTPDFCLPYFEGTDSPCVDTGAVCAPSTVWCDMARIIDDTFTGWDAIISRAVTSFPYAQVAVSDVPFTFTSGASNLGSSLVTWDTVVGDSDNMADLSVDATTLTIRRSGIWELHCVAVWLSSISDTQLSITLLHPGAPKISPVFATFMETWVEPVADPGDIPGPAIGLSNIMDTFVAVDTSSGPAQLQIELGVFAAVGNIIATVSVCQFSARWVADLP